MTHLLDVNVLLALGWPNHVHHATARAWFREIEPSGWATCGITESGFIRVSSNHRVTPDARTPGEAAILLHRITQRGVHQFIDDGVSLADAHERVANLDLGSTHVTDLHLLLICSQAHVSFATFDRGAASLAGQLDVAYVLLEG